jgi:Rieske Fe-S protein
MTTTPTHDADAPDTSPESGPAAPSRRIVLAGAGVVGAAAVLAACASGGGSSSGAGSGATDSSSGGSGGSGGTGGSTDGSSAAPQAQALGPVSDVPVGGGKVYVAQKVVVTQPSAGQFKCFTAVCTHAGCTVSTVSNGTINCPCHGSQYHITDGSVAQGPAPAPLAPEKITVSGGQISLT